MSKHALNKRLDQELLPEEIPAVKTAFVELLVEKGVSPDGFSVDQAVVFDIIQLVARENPLWRGIRGHQRRAAAARPAPVGGARHELVKIRVTPSLG